MSEHCSTTLSHAMVAVWSMNIAAVQWMWCHPEILQMLRRFDIAQSNIGWIEKSLHELQSRNPFELAKS